MIIKYTGDKPKKKVNIAGKEYIFAPTCEFNEIFDIAVINWLLHLDRAGLFVVESTSDATPSASRPDLTVAPTENSGPAEAEKPGE